MAVYESVRMQKHAMYHPQIPLHYTTAGNTYAHATNANSCEFACNYRATLDTSWSPIKTSRPDPPLLIQSSELYHRSVGQLPGFGGHVPGDINRFGRTYGRDTCDAKRYIRGDSIY